MRNTVSRIAVILALSLLAPSGQAPAQDTGGKAGWIAEKIARLFIPFESHIAKINGAAVYLTAPGRGAYHEGAMARIKNPDGSTSGYALVERIDDGFAIARLLRREGKMTPGRSMAVGAERPVRILWISGGGRTPESSLFMSKVGEYLRANGYLDVAPADVGRRLLEKSRTGAPAAIPRAILRQAAEDTMADYIALFTLDEKTYPAAATVSILDREAEPVYVLKESWHGISVKSRGGEKPEK